MGFTGRNTDRSRDAEIAHLVKCLACNYEELNSIPRMHVKEPVMVVHLQSRTQRGEVKWVSGTH